MSISGHVKRKAEFHGRYPHFRVVWIPSTKSRVRSIVAPTAFRKHELKTTLKGQGNQESAASRSATNHGGANSRFGQIGDSGLTGIFQGNGTGEILSANDKFLEMFGYTRADLDSGLIRWDRMTAPGYDGVIRRFREELATFGIASPAELEYFRKDGSRVPVLVGLASRDGAPMPSRMSTEIAIGFIFDLTQEKKAREDLRRSEEQFRQLTENIREVFWITDLAATQVLYVSPAYEQVWGASCESVYARPESWMESIHPDDRQHAAERFARQIQGEILENEYRIVQPSGDVRWIRDRAFPVRDDDGNMVRLAGVAEDITDRKCSELQLIHQALYDELTNLPNRRLFRDKLKQAISDCPPGTSGAVFFIDLDQFKLVNDTLGHLAGDSLLKEVADRLLGVCADLGTLARFGGDEFVFVATGFPEKRGVELLARKVIDCLDEPFHVLDCQVFVGASIGISVFPENGLDLFVLKRAADAAMHEAKRAGKNQIRFFSAELAEMARKRLEMETRLRKALSESEFRLQFQPQFPPGKAQPSRFEALIRWCPPDNEPISPADFVPIAEQNGLIVPIGKWVLREACRQCTNWQSNNFAGIGVAVNVSAVQFGCADFVETVAETLQLSGLAPHLLELELTESVFLKDMKASARILERLRILGVTVALDDFGTGFSSLSYLQNLPIDTLKIDRTFLLEAENRRKGAAVLRCVVQLAHTLGLRVVGEGVETPAQLNLAHSLGCDEIQGFLLGRPDFDVVGMEVQFASNLLALNAMVHTLPNSSGHEPQESEAQKTETRA